ncbi:RebB family R body protein [Marinomonas sp.]|uniref:RebB family R body protein n=1 Tax=Marinomonas sp. TaxID=1904862 RepID=UPI003BA9FA21
MSNQVTEAVSNTTFVTVGLSSANSAASLMNTSSTVLSIAISNAVVNQHLGNVTLNVSSTHSNAEIMRTSGAFF